MKYIEQINLGGPVHTIPNIVISSIYKICTTVKSNVQEKDVIISLNASITSSIKNSFFWNMTEEGSTFWSNILNYKRFSKFFEEYTIEKTTCFVHKYHYTLLKNPELPERVQLAFNNHISKEFNGLVFDQFHVLTRNSHRVYLCPCCNQPI